MARRTRREARTIGAREARAIGANLGRDLRQTRIRRRLTQAELADRVAVSQAEISALEAGSGFRTPIETWVAIGIALGRSVAIGFSREVIEPALSDAGHLAAQETVVRIATAAGWRGELEVPSDPLDPRHATDVVLAGRHGHVILVEIWNRIDDLGAALRSSDRKVADTRRRVASGSRIGSCWLFVDTTANRAIIRRYPALIRARFSGSSAGWVTALTDGTAPPAAPGVAWIDVRGGRVRELRLPARV